MQKEGYFETSQICRHWIVPWLSSPVDRQLVLWPTRATLSWSASCIPVYLPLPLYVLYLHSYDTSAASEGAVAPCSVSLRCLEEVYRLTPRVQYGGVAWFLLESLGLLSALANQYPTPKSTPSLLFVRLSETRNSCRFISAQRNDKIYGSEVRLAEPKLSQVSDLVRERVKVHHCILGFTSSSKTDLEKMGTVSQPTAP